MLAETVRDHAFIVAWFGLMMMVWFGWAQEDPPQRRRWVLGVGSVLGLALAGPFTYGVIRRWSGESALDGSYHIFGILVGIEVLAAALGCLYLWARGQLRWAAWWVGLVVALHFVPLAWLLHDPSVAGLGVVQAILLIALFPRLRAEQRTTSWACGVAMGTSFAFYAAVAALLFLVQHGTPW